MTEVLDRPFFDEGESGPEEDEEIRPQAGPQEWMLESPADIVLFGGQAGGGKTYALLLDPLRYIKLVPGYEALIVRRTFTQITAPGGLLAESKSIYPKAGGVWKPSESSWEFPPYGNKIVFAHMQYDHTVLNWQGSAIPTILWDEGTHFSERQITYMLSRNRSLCAVQPYMRITCNPDADHFLAEWVEWWLDDEGYPDYAKAGVIRYFCRLNNTTYWADTPEQLKEDHGHDKLVKSFTFIPSRLDDNPRLVEANPEYRANLQALDEVEKQRLLYGNWKVRADAGKIFHRDWLIPVREEEVVRSGYDCRFWDFASTSKEFSKAGDPDYTVGAKMRFVNGKYVILDIVRQRIGPAELDELLYDVTVRDMQYSREHSIPYMMRWEIEPGSAGNREAWRIVSRFRGVDAQGIRATKDKVARARPLASQARVGAIQMVEAPWNAPLLTELHNFPIWAHDDTVDAVSGAFTALTGRYSQGLDIARAFSWRRRQ